MAPPINNNSPENVIITDEDRERARLLMEDVEFCLRMVDLICGLEESRLPPS